jgi:hypothetical protein
VSTRGGQAENPSVASANFANLLTAPADFPVVSGANAAALLGVHRHIADACAMPLHQTE